MSAALSLLAVALLGADPTAGTAHPPIQYHVKLLEMEGLGWRESLYTRLRPVTRQGACNVWTADRELARPLTERASRVVMNPHVLAQSDAVAHFARRTSRRVASQLTRHADGPIDHAVAVAYVPEFEEVREGCQFTVTGRKIDQGVLTRLVVDETQVAAVHHVKLTEVVAAKDKQASDGKITPQLDVPEIVRASLEGEWLIPNDGVLVASLGAHTVDDGRGKAVVRERLLLVEANPAPSQTGVESTITRAITMGLTARPSSIPMPMPVPPTPGRSLPQGRSADGTPVPLPPLPESQVPPSSLPGSSEPCATPQAPHCPAVKPHDEGEPKTVDPDSRTASFEDGQAPPPPRADAQARPSSWSPIKPYLFRIPVSAGVTIEIRATVSPSPKP